MYAYREIVEAGASRWSSTSKPPRRFGLNAPQTLLVIADEVIE
jgi:hypothetical protein